VIRNIRRWWKGEISGKRCAKSVVDSFVCLGAGVGGCVAGAAVGSSFAPVLGTAIGAVTGSVIATNAAYLLVEWCTRYLFDLPKKESVENAFSFMEIPVSSSNGTINKRFR